MPIPASQIVEVNPRVITPGGSDLDFNGLLLSSSSVIPVSEIVEPFSSAADVASYFGTDSDEYRLALTYFQGYDNSFKKPTKLLVAAKVGTARSAFVRGGQPYTLEQLKTISSGTFSIVLDGNTVSLTGLTFASANSFSAVASTLQAALRAQANSKTAISGATVTYSSTLGEFTVTSGKTGADNTLACPTGTVATALGMQAGGNAVVSPGSAALSPAANMNAILEKTRNFVCFMSIDKLSASEAVAYSEWAAAQGVNYLHVFWDDDSQNIASSPSGTIAQALTAANASSVCGIYGTAEYAAFIMSIAACVDYDRTNGTITFKFKGQGGLDANVTSATVADRLDSLGMNFIGNYATRNDNFVFLANGEMWSTSSMNWAWIDSYLNAIWLNNALQVACMTGFQNTARAPYTEEGYALVRSWCMDPINRALTSGIIEPGVTLSESQKAQLQREAGTDISTNLYTDGYYLKVADPSPAVRQQRMSPECSLWYCYGGAIHRLVIASTAVV